MAKARSLPYLDAHIPNRENAYLIIKARLAELYSWEPYVDNPGNVSELHNLRIAAKRLRYSFEVFEDVLPPESIALRAEMVKIQEELGELHDSDVLTSLLQLCLNTRSSASNNLKNPEPNILQEIQQKNLDLSKPLLRRLLDSHTLPDEEEYRGLALFLDNVIHERAEQYTTFRRHWHALEEHDYGQDVLALLDKMVYRCAEAKNDRRDERGG